MVDWNTLLWKTIAIIPRVGGNSHIYEWTMKFPLIYISNYFKMTSVVYSIFIVILILLDYNLSISNPFYPRTKRMNQYKIYLLLSLIPWNLMYYTQLTSYNWRENLVYATYKIDNLSVLIHRFLLGIALILIIRIIIKLSKKGTSN